MIRSLFFLFIVLFLDVQGKLELFGLQQVQMLVFPLFPQLASEHHDVFVIDHR